ncbi:MAG: UDP-2,3-diacylglucosamine diphosphatase [Phycisphaerales bacterium JB043]
MDRTRYRAVFISDLHLGSRGSRAASISHFLKQIRCDRLYLVGDVIDFWRLRGRVYWPWQHNAVLRRLLILAKHGTEIYYIPGNHDESLRQYEGLEFGGIKILNECEHTTADGKRLLVTHGDQFDMVVTHHKLISWLGSAAYEWLLVLNRFYNRYRRWRGKPYWSLSKHLKKTVKSACTFVSHFEETLSAEAKKRGFHGVVCGHIHTPELDESREISYYNCGDWIEHSTALVEYMNGEMEIVDFINHSHHIEGSTHTPEQLDVDLRREILVAAMRDQQIELDEFRASLRS